MIIRADFHDDFKAIMRGGTTVTCECAEMDWTGCDMTLAHHPNCDRRLVHVANPTEPGSHIPASIFSLWDHCNRMQHLQVLRNIWDMLHEESDRHEPATPLISHKGDVYECVCMEDLVTHMEIGFARSELPDSMHSLAPTGEPFVQFCISGPVTEGAMPEFFATSEWSAFKWLARNFDQYVFEKGFAKNESSFTLYWRERPQMQARDMYRDEFGRTWRAYQIWCRFLISNKPVKEEWKP